MQWLGNGLVSKFPVLNESERKKLQVPNDFVFELGSFK